MSHRSYKIVKFHSMFNASKTYEGTKLGTYIAYSSLLYKYMYKLADSPGIEFKHTPQCNKLHRFPCFSHKLCTI